MNMGKCRKSDYELEVMLLEMKAKRTGIAPVIPPPPQVAEPEKPERIHQVATAVVESYKIQGKPAARKKKVKLKRSDPMYRYKQSLSQEYKSDAMLSERTRLEIREGRMRLFFARVYPGFSEFYAESREDSGWSQAFSPDDSMPETTGYGDALAMKGGPKSDGGLRNHPWRAYR